MKLSELGIGPDTGANFKVAEDGTYLCELANIEIKEYPSFDDKEIYEEKIVFTYKMVKPAEDGELYTFKDFIRKVKFLTDSSNLAKRLDQMLGRRLADDEFDDFDLDELMDMYWRVTVIATPNGRNKIVSVKPHKAAPAVKEIARPAKTAAKPAPEDEDMEDPFAE